MKLFKRISLLCLFILTLSTSIFAKEHHTSWNGDPNTPFEEVNGNIPYFTDEEKQNTKYFLELGELDNLGRCTACFMNVSKEKLPTDDREPSLSSVTPTGWKFTKLDEKGKKVTIKNNVNYNKIEDGKYKGLVSGGYVLNRCHILGYQMSGLNAEKKNLISGTRFLNVIGQLPFENDVASYVKKTGNHVLYRVTPIFEGNNLFCEGVREEAWSVEDNGQGICFNVFCYNVQPNIEFDYSTGENWVKNSKTETTYIDPFYKEETVETKKETTQETVKSVKDNTIEDIKDNITSSITEKIDNIGGNMNSSNMGIIIVIAAILLFLIMNNGKGKKKH